MTELAIIGIAPSGVGIESHKSIKVEELCTQLQALIAGVTSIEVPNAKVLPLQQLELGVVVHANGNLGVIEAGVQASITLTFGKGTPPG